MPDSSATPAHSTARVTLTLALPAARLFDAWLDAGRMFRALQVSGALGRPQTMVRVQIEPRVGGTFDWVDRLPGAAEVSHHGQVLVLQRPTQIVYSWSVPAYGTHDERVTLDVIPDAADPAGRCIVTLTHLLAPHPPEIIAAAEASWRALLLALADTLLADVRATPNG